ncbi:acyl-CoA thioesterase [Burkholderiales bacterium]|nr:MAG: PaaI family thioesterase [Burkholderiales bacterium]CAG1000673.1 acyl-CoA thioesterase [Burkholderiales bacterium]
MTQAGFEVRDPDYDARVRRSFARQGAMAFLGVEIALLEPGRCTLALHFRPELAQQHGYFHGGLVGALADTAGGYAAYTLMGAEASILTAEYKINLLAPAEGELLLAQGRVVKPGRTLSISTAEVYVEKHGRRTLCALMQQTLMAIHGRSDPA